MAKFFRGFLLLALVCACTWAAVIIYWQEIHLLPTVEDIVLYLAVLPLAIFAVILLVRALWRWRAARKAAALAAPAVVEADGASVSGKPVPACLRIHAAAVATPLGEELSAIAALLAAEPVPPLDAELLDYNGFPIPARRCADIDLSLLPPAWLDDGETPLPPGEQRRYALLASLVGRSLDAPLAFLAASQLAGRPAPQQHRTAELNPAWLGEDVPLVESKGVMQRVPAYLQVQLLLDALPEPAVVEQLKTWLVTLLAMCGMSEAQLQLEVRAMSASGLPKHLNALSEEVAGLKQPFAILMLACGSNICQVSLDQNDVSAMSAGGMRFPGEAAAALLLCNAAFQLEGVPPIAQLAQSLTAPYQPEYRHRPHAATALISLWDALADSESKQGELAWVCTGLGLGPEVIEAAPLFAAAANPVQPDEGVHLRGAIGDAGVAARLSAYALAAQAVAEQGKASLLVINDGEGERGLCLLTSVPEPAAIDDAVVEATAP